MRLGVFGGSFDPPHNGHLALCRLAHDRLGIDRLIISVSKNPFKAGADASDLHRLRMAELLSREIDPTGRFAQVSTWELERPGPSYTIDLLRHLHASHPSSELLLLLGEDSYRDLPRWKSADEIVRLCRVVVFARPSAKKSDVGTGAALPAAGFFELDVPVSATEVRGRLARGETADHLVPPSIAAYITANGLYRPAT